LHPGRRNFLAVWPSLFATSMGLMAFLPMLALYVQERFGIDDPSALTFWASIVYGAAPFSAALAGPIWGAMGDRFGKRPMAIRANLAIAVTTALMPLAPSPLVLLCMRALQGVLAGYVAPAMSLVTQGLPKRVHGRVIAKLQVAMATGSFLGPYLGAALQLHWFAREVAPVPAVGSTFLGHFLRGCAALLQQRVFAWLLVALLVLRLGQNMLEPLLALFLQRLGAEPWLASCSATPGLALDRTVAIAFALLAVAQWVCTPWWGRLADRHGPLRCLGWLSLGLAVVYVVMPLAGSTRQFLAWRAVAACLMAGSLTLAYAAASKRVADAHRTLSFAMVQSCIQFGLSLGPLLGAVAAASGPADVDFPRAFWLAAALCGVAGAAMFWLRASSRPVAAAAC
jgi:MFS family permease